MTGKAIVEIKNVNKFYGNTHVVKNLNMTVYEGEFLSILGPSGCGKTTTLRMIAGFEQQSDGDILVEGNPVEDKEPYDRNVNTVFQSYALFPHMNIHDNIAFGLKMKKISRIETEERVNEALQMVRLEGFEKRFPSQLSGGQKQRVAIARAIINRPRVLLLDEPLGALDMKLRKQMQIELKRLQKKLGITFIYVTHDQEEALTMSDRIAVMNGGVLEQMDTPSRIYDHPKSKFVADFIGESNLFEGCIGSSADGVHTVTTESGEILGKGEGFAADELIYVSVRPEKIKCSSAPVEGFSIRGVVKENIFIGTLLKTIIALPDNNEIKMTAISGGTVPAPGSAQYLYWDVADAVLMHNVSHRIYSLIENVDLSSAVEGA
jgi:spermidine/putrescine transport system ATP-binding protein